MNSLKLCFVLAVLVLGLVGTPPPVLGQSEKPANDAKASKAEVDELRKEVASQRRAIEQLQALIERMIDTKAPATTLPTDGAHLVNATLTTPIAEATPAAAPGRDGCRFLRVGRRVNACRATRDAGDEKRCSTRYVRIQWGTLFHQVRQWSVPNHAIWLRDDELQLIHR